MSFKEKLLASFEPESIITLESFSKKDSILLSLVLTAVRYRYDFLQDESATKTVIYLKKK